MDRSKDQKEVPVILHWHWVNPAMQRYYAAYLVQDLLGNWVLTKVWNSKNTRLGSSKNVFCETYETGLSLIEKLKKQRLSHGYVVSLLKILT